MINEIQCEFDRLPLMWSKNSYPKQYGSRSPSFARGTLHLLSNKEKLYISGTASIRSHKTIGMTREEQLDITYWEY